MGIQTGPQLNSEHQKINVTEKQINYPVSNSIGPRPGVLLRDYSRECFESRIAYINIQIYRPTTVHIYVYSQISRNSSRDWWSLCIV